MNESTSALLKIITSLTSIKTSVKFATTAIFLIILWRTSEFNMIVTYVPDEQKSIVFSLISAGFGFIVGEVIYHLLSFIYQKTVGKYKIRIERLKAQAIEREKKEKLLNNFIKTYSHFNKETKRILLSLSDCAQNIWDDPECGIDTYALTQNNYIRRISIVDSCSSIYELHPILAGYLKVNVPLEMDEAFSALDLDNEITKINLIALLSGELNVENLQSKTSEVISFCKRHNEIIEYSAHYKDKESDNFGNYIVGYYVWIDEFHVERFNEKFNIKAKDRVFIQLDEFRTQ